MTSNSEFIWLVLGLIGMKVSPILAVWATENKDRGRLAALLSALSVVAGLMGTGITDIEILISGGLAAMELSHSSYKRSWKNSKTIAVAESLVNRVKAPAHGDV